MTRRWIRTDEASFQCVREFKGALLEWSSLWRGWVLQYKTDTWFIGYEGTTDKQAKRRSLTFLRKR